MTAACSGISSERNTTINTSADSSTTTPMKNGSRSASTREKSIWVAVDPPMWAVIPELRASAGMTSARMCLTSCSVSLLWGEVVG